MRRNLVKNKSYRQRKLRNKKNTKKDNLIKRIKKKKMILLLESSKILKKLIQKEVKMLQLKPKL